MLSIKAIGSVGYYLELAREDYYVGGGEPPGQWWGRGAEKLSLAVTAVEKEGLKSLAQGFSPDGESLVQNAGREQRQAGWDLTFSAPKSVSVLWAHADAELRRQIQETNDLAVQAALSYLEEEIAFTRRGKHGTEREQAGIVAATFQHGTSRALDPQLHTHCLVLNVAARADGTFGTLLSKPFYNHKMTMGALYRTELAYQLQRLGFQCEQDRTSFSVVGVPKGLCRDFSKRREVIEEELSSYGLETASAAAIATLATRQVKDLVPPRKDLFRKWKEAGQAYGFTADAVRKLLGTPAHAITKGHYEKALAEAVKTLTASQSHFSERELLCHVAQASQHRTLDARYIRRAVKETLAHNSAFVCLGEDHHETRYTTKEMLALEKKLLDAVRRSKETERHVASTRTVDAVVERYSKPQHTVAEEARYHARGLLRAARRKKTSAIDRVKLRDEARHTLSEEQEFALRYMTQTPGSIKLLSGYAGSGKTLLLKAACEIWEKEGYTVIGACLSGQAARTLATKTGIQSETLRMLQFRMEPSLAYELKHHAKQLLRAAVHKPTFKLNPLRLDAKTVLVVDEAAMIGTKQMYWLVDAARRAGAKLVLTGEAEQLQPIEAGGPFPALARIVGQSQLTEIRRQLTEGDKKMVLDMRAGEAKSVLSHLAQQKGLFVEKNRAAAIERLLSDWEHRESGNPTDCLVFCGVNAERKELNRRCQAIRASAGHLDTSQRMTLEDGDIYRGDRVILRQNSRKLGVQNGNRGTVVHMNRLLGTLTVELDDKRCVTLPLDDYKIRYGEHKGKDAVQLAYALTTHSGQGATVPRAYILAGGSMQDRELSYVQVSRHVEEVRMYTDRYEAGPGLKTLARQMSRSRKKDLADDVQRRAKEAERERELALEQTR